MASSLGTGVDSRRAWIAATAALAILVVAHGAPLVSVVALKAIAHDLGTSRGGPSAVPALVYVGAAVGGIVAGWLAGRLGARLVVLFGGVMIAVGLFVSSLGGLSTLYVGHGLLIGLFGASCMMSPLLTYVSLWFERSRGQAVALISLGQSSGRSRAADAAGGAHRRPWLASDHAGLCGSRPRYSDRARPAIPARAARGRRRSRRAGRDRRRPRQGAGTAAQHRDAPADAGGGLLLHPGGDAVAARRGVLRRSRYPARRGDALGAAGAGLRGPAVLGLAVRPYRRPEDADVELAGTGGHAVGLPDDAQRGGALRRIRRVWLRLRACCPPMSSPFASCSRRARRAGACRSGLSPDISAWPPAAGGRA